MKKIIICLWALIVCCWGCEDYLNVKPSNVQAIRTYDEVKALLGGHLRMYAEPDYDNLEGTSIPYIENDIWTFLHFYGDDIDVDTYVKNRYIFGNIKNLYVESANWKNTTQPGVIWKAYYSNIGFFNTIIDELSRVEASKEQADIVRCEAKVLRAWHLFKLMQYFSPYHLNKYGLPVNLDAQKVAEYDASRKTQEEVYRIIISDLTECVECTTEPRSTYNVFYDKNIIHAILAQVFLYKGDSGAKADDDYENAVSHAKSALEALKLQSTEDYEPFPVYNEVLGISKEAPHALMVDFRSANELRFIVGNPKSASQNLYSSASLYALFKDNDIRKTKFFNDKQVITKYMNIATGYVSVELYQFWSAAEMYLIIAESYARSGNESEGKKWLEDFQKHRYSNYNGYQGNDLLQEILNERRREFCYEYDMRWCDLSRLQTGWTRSSYEDAEHPTYTLEDNDYRFTLPIPVKEELQYNDIEQNPGWLIVTE